MAGTFKIKALGEGQLPAATGVLYTVPASTQTIIKTMIFVNTNVAVRTINIFLKTGGTNRRIVPKDLSLKAQYLMETDQEYTLEAGDTVEGDASAASSIDFTIHGIEET